MLGYVVEKGIVRPDPERFLALDNLGVPQNIASQRRVLGLFSYYSKWITKFSEKIRLLNTNTVFPHPDDVILCFQTLKDYIKSDALSCIDESIPFDVETDASDYAIAATLNQGGRPVAFCSTLNKSEKNHTLIEKEAYAIVEALRKWRYLLVGRLFKVITDQQAVSFIFNNRRGGKVKNDKINRWRFELSEFKYDIVYRHGSENVAPDALSRACTINMDWSQLRDIHDSLCHPGITRLLHFIRSRNLPYSIQDIKTMTSNCEICVELKPIFHKSCGTLIKATQPFERLNIDFKGPLPSASVNKYILTVVDEYSRYPFALPCKDMNSSTVILCFRQLFSLFGTPAYIHSYRAPNLLSKEVKYFLCKHGIASSKTSHYTPKGNGQVERYNGVIWKTVTLSLRGKNMNIKNWESVLAESLHAIRSLLCTSTNQTPHERLFKFQRRAATGISMPSWLMIPGPVYLRRYAKNSKYDPSVE